MQPTLYGNKEGDRIRSLYSIFGSDLISTVVVVVGIIVGVVIVAQWRGFGAVAAAEGQTAAQQR